ncbi:probable FBD-associated F-box protein At1g32375 [Lotus japonicus]|uniref:probable FBD-associated F-box protein At1g32375 n=1 Tax=Lotus japonicus TaxID=34305 RepID=UPI00258BDE3C|nr:probable FBD-associated F-box protein At1g32375 [Lotus japonicus]
MHLRNIHCHNIHSIPHYNNFKSLSKLVRADIYEVYFDLFVESPKFDKYLDDILLFPNLTHVELRLGENMMGENMSWHLVLAMLKHCPMLQNFVLTIEITWKFYEDLVWIFPCFVPECLFSQLRECSILDFGGNKNELHFAKYILLNSRVLRTMTVCTRPSPYLEVSKVELLKELSLYPRSSKICELSFT